MWKRKPRPSPFTPTEEQIRAKAYELWQQREGKGGSAEADWQQAIAELESNSSHPNDLKKHLDAFGSKDDREFALKVKQFQWERLKTLISALGLAATIFAGIGLYLTYKTGQDQLQLAREQQQQNVERLITERFAKAVEQLGSPQLDVRIGAIYSLERIAKDSPKDHWTIMEVLIAFVCDRSPVERTPEAEKLQLAAVASDIQSALTVVGRRDVKHDLRYGELNLRETNLAQANLNDANLQGAYLIGTNLQRTFLYFTNLQKVFLYRANLQGARLYKTQLQKADLRYANLQEANLINANLQEVNFRSAKLQRAIFLATDLRQAKLLTQEQLEGANPPLLCHVSLPNKIKVNPDRDCNRVPQELVKRTPILFPDIEAAQAYVNKSRQKKWDQVEDEG